MKILVVSQHYFPENFLITDICEELVKRGHSVDVLCGLPNYPQGFVLDEYKTKEKWEQCINGVNIHRCKEFGRGHSSLSLVLNYLSFIHFSKKRIKKIKKDFDIVYCYQLSPVTSAVPAVYYCKKHNLPLFLYCLDIWPESAKAHVKSNGLIFKFLKKISKSIYSKCDLIGVTSEPFIEYLNKENEIPIAKMTYLPQHSKEDFIEIEEHKINSTRLFLYAGNLGVGQKVEVIIKAASLLKGNFKIIIAGDGSNKNNLSAMVKQMNLSNIVFFVGNLSKEKMIRMYYESDALLITLRGNNFVGNTMPGKFQTYLSVGRPIFGSINGATYNLIKKIDCGGCVEAENPQGLATLMQDFIDNPCKYKECGQRGKTYFLENFRKDIVLCNLENLLKECYESFKKKL